MTYHVSGSRRRVPAGGESAALLLGGWLGGAADGGGALRHPVRHPGRALHRARLPPLHLHLHVRRHLPSQRLLRRQSLRQVPKLFLNVS